MTFVLKKIKSGRYKGQWRFAIVATNNEQIDPRQPYNSKESALHAVDLIRGMKDAPIKVIE
jgi:Uncharacterized conserved protein